MNNTPFNIELKSIHWLENYGNEDEFDLCAHGKIRVIIGNEIIVDNTDDKNDWWSLTATALHLLRTLDQDHIPENLVGDCLVPGEGHHLDHHENNPFVHVETAYPMVEGVNWWVKHENDKIKLITQTSKETIIPFNDYKSQVLNFVDKVETFYKNSKPKVLPDDNYDREAYIKLWNEWHSRRNKWRNKTTPNNELSLKPN